jgi:hypothetical protein
MFNTLSTPSKPRKLDFNQLKKLTIEAEDLGQPFNYFFDMAERPDFLTQQRRIDKPEDHPILKYVLIAVQGIADTIGQDFKIKQGLILEEPEHHFFHGSWLLEYHFPPLGMFYFADIQVGLIARMDENRRAQIFRFSLAEQKSQEQVH